MSEEEVIWAEVIPSLCACWIDKELPKGRQKILDMSSEYIYLENNMVGCSKCIYIHGLDDALDEIDTKQHCLVKHPAHYNQGIECWDYIVSHNLGFLEGNIIKYITRYKDKDDPMQDLKKARAYLGRLMKELRET